MKYKFLLPLSILCSSAAFWSCTDLDEHPYGEVAMEKMPKDALVETIYESLKGDWNSAPEYVPFAHFVYMVQVSTDEIAMPTCANSSDWEDGGVYYQMQSHTWTPDNKVLESAWSYCFKIVSVANSMLALQDKLAFEDQQIAECRLLRAYGYYRLMDLFGDVPLIDENHEGLAPRQSSRKEVFAWIEKELNDPVMESLKDKRYGKMDKGVLHTLKARLYLNSKVFLGLEDDSAEYKEYLEKCIEECDNVQGYELEKNVFANFYMDNGPSSKEIIFAIPYNADGSTLGNRTQMTSYWKIQNKVFGGDMYQHCINGIKLNPGESEDDENATFNLFQINDNRRLALLYGQQYSNAKKDLGAKIWLNYETVGEVNDAKTEYTITKPFKTYETEAELEFAAGDKVSKDADETTFNALTSECVIRNGKLYHRDYATYNPFFTDGLTAGASSGAFNARGGDGARIIKFEIEENPVDYESGVDMVVMRYAEVLYMKAEALIRLGRAGESVDIFKQVLATRGWDPATAEKYNYILNEQEDYAKDGTWAKTLMSKRWLTTALTSLEEIIPGEPDLEFMDQELRREFIFEDHRRADMIRMGKFTKGTWGGHLTPDGSENRNIFPIPTKVLSSNPNLVQNAYN